MGGNYLKLISTVSIAMYILNSFTLIQRDSEMNFCINRTNQSHTLEHKFPNMNCNSQHKLKLTTQGFIAKRNIFHHRTKSNMFVANGRK